LTHIWFETHRIPIQEVTKKESSQEQATKERQSAPATTPDPKHIIPAGSAPQDGSPDYSIVSGEGEIDTDGFIMVVEEGPAKSSNPKPRRGARVRKAKKRSS